MAKFVKDEDIWWNLECHDPKITLYKYDRLRYIVLNNKLDIYFENVRILDSTNDLLYILKINIIQFKFLMNLHEWFKKIYEESNIKEKHRLYPAYQLYYNSPVILVNKNSNESIFTRLNVGDCINVQLRFDKYTYLLDKDCYYPIFNIIFTS